MSKAKLGAGTQLRRGDGFSPEGFTLIPEVRTIPPVGAKNDLVEVTSLDSRAKEYIAGLKDGSELSFAVNFDHTDAQHIGLQADQQNAVTRNFQLFFPDVVGASPETGYLMTFAAAIIQSEVGGGPNEARTLNVTLKVSNEIQVETIS